MKHSAERILTTHCGSLARPKDLLDLMKAKVNGEPYDESAYTQRVRIAVAEVVSQQVECGIDIVTDGEQGNPGFLLTCASASPVLKRRRRHPELGSSGRRKWRPSRSTTNNTSAGA